MLKVETVAIIGSGLSGLTAIKACLEENLKPVCFELSDTLGGSWNLTESHVAGQGAAVYPSMLLNTSRDMSCFSDFPFPHHLKQYMDCQSMRDYLQSYANHFQLTQYIQFCCEVTHITQSHGYDHTGRWNVQYVDRDGNSTTREFDAVMVCSGRNRLPKYPVYPGKDDFSGETMHTIDYRRPDVFRDKVILVIGNGSSAADVAVDAVPVARKVYMCTGDGFWIIPRETAQYKRPQDRIRRIMYQLPTRLMNWILSQMLNRTINHRSFNIIPESNRGPAHSVLCVNDKIAKNIESGKIVLKQYIKRFTKQGVVFGDATSVDVDFIVYATGYQTDYRFLDTSIFQGILDKDLLYRLVLPIGLPHPTLCIIGGMAVKGAVSCTFETQARWVVALWTDWISLPTVEDMVNEVAARKREMVQLYGKEKLWVLGISYQDELAGDLGLIPPFWTTLLTRPLDTLRFYFAPAFPMTLRLYGRHAWPGARRAIAEVQDKF